MSSLNSPSFRNALLTPVGNQPSSTTASATSANPNASLQSQSTLNAQVINAVMMQQQANQTAIQYKAQVLIANTQYQLVTQFPLAEGDQLELQRDAQGKLNIAKVVANPSSTAQTNTPNAAAVNIPLANQSNTATVQTDPSAPLKPIDQQQIQQVIRLWLNQSRPALGSLLDLTLSIEAASKLLEMPANLSSSNSSTEQNLAKLLSQILETIQKELFRNLPNAEHQEFRQQIRQFISQMLQWSTDGKYTPSTQLPTSSNNIPSPLTADRTPNTLAQNNPLQSALNNEATSVLKQSSILQNSLIDSLLRIQGTIQQSLDKITTEVTSTPSTSTQPSNMPILKEWMQVLTLMAPSSNSHQDMLNWLLESIRRISGNSSQLLTPDNPLSNTNLSQAKQASEALASAIKTGGAEHLISTAARNASSETTTAPQANQPLSAQQNAAIQTAIDSSQWLRLAEFRKHQLFSGSVKHALLQNTQELQLTNVMRQLLVSVEELTGRMTSLRLASAASSADTGQSQMIHMDIPVMTQSGPTNVEMDLQYQPEESQESKEQTEQWVVYLKFELPPIAPFIGQIIFQKEPPKMTANFYSSHQATLALLQQETLPLQHKLEQDSSSEIHIQTRFGLIEMPRNSLTKQSLNKVNMKA